MKKVVLMMFTLVCFTGSLFANTQGESGSVASEDQVTMNFTFAGGDPLVKELMIQRIDKFNSSNPDINVVAMPSGSGAYTEYVKTKDAVGEFPDMLEARATAVWIRAGKLAPLPTESVELIKTPPLYEGEEYVVPLSISAAYAGILYNNTIFTELGLSEPKTYQEFITLLDTIKASGVAPMVVGAKDAWHLGFLWGHFWNVHVFSQNKEWIGDRYRGDVKFTDANVQAALTDFSDLFKNGYVEKGYQSTADNQLASFLTTGKAAMFISGSWMIQQIMDADPEFDLGWAPIPDRDGKFKMTFGPSLEGLALSAEAANDPKKVDAFNRFVAAWYNVEDYTEYLATTNQTSGAKATITPNYSSKVFGEITTAMASADFSDVLWNQKWGEGELPPSFRNYAYKAFQEMLANDGTVEDLCIKLDKQWEKDSAEFNPTK